jgi:hypothetical protein
MKTSHFLHRSLTVLAVVFMASVLQGCLTVKCDDCCGDGSGGTAGQGYCSKHRMGAWTTDATKYPNCAIYDGTHNSWVCSNLNGSCADAANPNGTCQLSPSSGNCDCKCL